MTEGPIDISSSSIASAAPSPVLHNEFKTEIGKSVGYLLDDGYFALKGASRYVFVGYAVFYLLGPLAFVSYFAYRWHSLDILWGIAASYAGSFISAKSSKRGSFEATLFTWLIGTFAYVAFHTSFGTWFSTWFSSEIVFIPCCALWGAVWYSIADAAQDQFAIQAIIDDPRLYDFGIASGKLNVFRFSDVGKRLASDQPISLARNAKLKDKQSRTSQTSETTPLSPEAERMQEQIKKAVEAAYSEEYEYASIAEHLAPSGGDLRLLRANIAIQVAAQLKEPLTQADVEFALRRFKGAERLHREVSFSEVLHAHQMLATWAWMRKHLRILHGKLASKQNENSAKGKIYELEHQRQGPLDLPTRQEVERLSKEIEVLDDQIKAAELDELKESNPDEHARYAREIADWKMRLRNDAEKQEESEFEIAGWMAEEELKLTSLSSKASAPPSEQKPDQVHQHGSDIRRVQMKANGSSIAFVCPSCKNPIRMSMDTAGHNVTCANCRNRMLVPTTIQQAERIVDIVSGILERQEYVFSIYLPLSKTGASNKLQLANALMIAAANTYRRIFSSTPTPNELEIWSNFSQAAGSTMVAIALRCFPDSELQFLQSLPGSKRFDPVAMAEEKRLHGIAEADTAFAQIETIKSFAKYLDTLDVTSNAFWPLVYARLGLPYPLEQ
jgi:hypothetical protein